MNPSNCRCPMCVHGAPKHPGEVLHTEYLKPQGISLQEAANRVGVTRQSISNLVNGKTSMSITMAMALSREFGRTCRGVAPPSRLTGTCGMSIMHRRSDQCFEYLR